MKDKKNILKWLENELSNEETQDLKQSSGFKTLEKIAHYSSQMEAPRVNPQEALAAFRAKNSNKPKVRTLQLKSFYKYAAILIVALTVTYLMVFNNAATTFNTEMTQIETITLPDHSQVTLNALSSLRFNKKRWEKERRLSLEGEAFFKVSKGQKFTVETDAGKIQVLGTQFNVKARDNYFEVQCYEGLVAVNYKNKTTKLSKGKSFRVINNTIEMVDDFSSLNPSWINKESSFIKVPLQYVIEELENVYGIQLITNKINTNTLFTGTFTHNNKNIALQAVTVPLKLSYKVEGNTITLYKYEE